MASAITTLAVAPTVSATDLVEAWHAAQTWDATDAAAQFELHAALESREQGDAALSMRIDLTATAGQVRHDYRSGDSATKASARSQGQKLGAAVVLTRPIHDAAGGRRMRTPVPRGRTGSIAASASTPIGNNGK